MALLTLVVLAIPAVLATLVMGMALDLQRNSCGTTTIAKQQDRVGD